MSVSTKFFSMRALWPLGLFASLIILFGWGLTRDPSVLPTEMVDRPFPEFSLGTLDNPDALITHDIMLGEISLVNIFGSWCTACVQEHPTLMEIGTANRVRLIGVDWRDSRAKGQRWINYYGNPYEVILFDEHSELAIGLGVTGAPETYIIDQAGKIRYKHIGILTDEIWQQTFLPLIERLEVDP